MITKQDIETLIAEKQAGISRMLERQKRVHLRMAKLVEDRPDCINDALNKVRNRLANTGLATSDIYAKWNEILLNWPVSKIVSLLRDDSPDTEQLRACAPFSFGKYESVESVSYAGR